MFKEENVQPTAEEKYALIPTFWHEMTEAERKVVMMIMTTNNFEYNANTLRQLHTECKIPYSQMNDLHVCVIIAKEHPESLAFPPPARNTNNQDDVSDDVAVVGEARAEMSRLNTGLAPLQWIPKDVDGKPKYTGEALLNHMARVRNVNAAAESKDGGTVQIAPTAGLDVELADDALECIQPTVKELGMGAAMRNTVGVNKAKRKCAKRKMTNIGTIVGHSGVVNSKENMKKMKDQLVLADAISEINALEAADKEKKKNDMNTQHNGKAPAAAKKLRIKGRVVASLTVTEIEALLFKLYNTTMSGSKLRKPDYVKELQAALTRDVEKYDEYLLLLDTMESNANDTNDIGDDLNDIGVDISENGTTGGL